MGAGGSTRTRCGGNLPFCRLDDLLAAEAASTIRFERTQTLARGGTLCDFRYERVRR